MKVCDHCRESKVINSYYLEINEEYEGELIEQFHVYSCNDCLHELKKNLSKMVEDFKKRGK